MIARDRTLASRPGPSHARLVAVAGLLNRQLTDEAVA